MAVKRADPSVDLWTRYENLPPGPKLLLRLKSLAGVHVQKNLLNNCLTSRDVRALGAVPWTTALINDVTTLLGGLGLLGASDAVTPGLAHRVACDTMASDDGALLAATIRRVFPAKSGSMYGYYSPHHANDVTRLIRLAIYENDAAAFIANRERFGRECASDDPDRLLVPFFAAEPLALDWFEGRTPPMQTSLVRVKLAAARVIDAMDPDLPRLVASYRMTHGRAHSAMMLPGLAAYDLLNGDLDAVRTTIAERDGTDKTVEQMSLAACVAFLQEQNDMALQLFRDALKRLRKQTGKRKIFLGAPYSVFFVLALLRANDSKLHAEIATALNILSDTAVPNEPSIVILAVVLTLVQGAHHVAVEQMAQMRAFKSDDVGFVATRALAEYLVDPLQSRKNVVALADEFTQIKDAQPLFARIHAEILAEVAPKPAPYAAFLAETSPGVTLAFTRIIETRQSWEWALDSLSTLLGANTAKADAPPRKAKRLAWFIDPETLDINPLEQQAKGVNGWTDGRPVALARLRTLDPRLNYLTEQDRAVARTITRAPDMWSDDQLDFDPDRALPALVGHPCVYDARHRALQLDLVREAVELVIAETKAGYHVALSHSAEQPCVFLEAETPTRYRVIEFPPSLLEVHTILGDGGLTVPRGARDRLVELAQRNNPTLPIRDEIGAVPGSVQEGQSAPVVQLVPVGDGVKLALLVRAFGPDGPAYVAGLGARSVQAIVQGQALRANRDLPKELAERAALIAACPTLRDRGGSGFQDLIIEDLPGCLDLLLELQAYTGPLAVEWPAGRSMQVSTITPDKMKIDVKRDRDWFHIDGAITLDDDQVVDMRFLLDRLDGAQGRFVVLGDGRFAALTRQLQTQLEALAAVAEPHRGGQRVHALGAPALDAVLTEAGNVTADVAWTRHVAQIRSAQGWTPKLPPTLQADLRDYQVEGFVWMSRLARWGAGACLADDMGLGKTVQAIAVLLDRAEGGPSLVVAPTSVCPNWVAELTRFAPTLMAHRFATASDRAALVAGLGPRDVLVCSYGLLHQAAELLGEKPWETVVLDEAQAIKNATTKRAQASLGLQAGFRLALTGTPVENYLDELWSLFNFVNPGLLGAREAFQRRFAGPIERNQDAHARQALRNLVRPFLLRRTKAAVLSELPPRTEQTILVEKDEAERAFYEALRQRALERIAALEGAPGTRKFHILAEITRLRRASCNPALIDPEIGVPSGKLAAFMDLVDELIRNRHRALVFSQFTGHLALIRAALDRQAISYQYLDGSTPAADRERRVAAFQAGQSDLFLISLRAGGTGLNLTAADYVVHLDPWWNPAVEDQASDRAHRIGQERPVTIYRLVMQDSIEERILSMHGEKRELAAALLDGAEISGRLDEDALLDLIRG